MRRRLTVTLLYAVAAAAVAALWTLRAKTENQSNNWASIVAIADGSAPRPFVKRRLLCDAARVVAAAVPAPAWEAASGAIDRRPALARLVRDRLGWEREDDPLLLSATALIGLSAFGFMAATRWLVWTVYVTPRPLADLAGLLLGLALLGGGGDVRFGWFPYDIPHAFVFALTLAAVLARSVWVLPAFAAAAYSKETSVLLIPAVFLARGGRPNRETVLTAGAMALTFLVVQQSLSASFGPGPGGFWFLGRNARWLAWLFAYDAWWYYPPLVVSAVRIARLRGHFPGPLRRLAVLAVVPLALAFFKGWIEEKRQYLELIPILGPLLIQWVLVELGFSRLMRARTGSV